MTIFPSILLGIDRSVIPRQLLQSLREPFYGVWTMTPLVQSSGAVVSFQIVLKSGCKKSASIAGSALNSSALRLSSPGALPVVTIYM